MSTDPLRALFAADHHEQVVALANEAARDARWAPLPQALAASVKQALAAQGVERLYSHQREVFDLLTDGQHVVVATGTASGKSLCFGLPTMQTFAEDSASRALYLYPTKALAQDQARKLSALKLKDVVPAIYDGDTPQDQRSHIRTHATVLLSNPDMLHVGILPNHERWAEYLHHLRYVVLDEAHVYRGVFGSHVAQVIRRLRRLCSLYGSDPQFVLASATIANPREFAERLVGVPFRAVTEDGAPRPERTIVFWNPELEDPATGVRRSALAESAYVIAEAILAGKRVIGFAPSRKAAEVIYTYAKRRIGDRDQQAGERLQPYRAGYTAQQRRKIEKQLFDGRLDGVVATSALELGIDVGSLDLALVTGFPGTVTSLLQRWGRAGRTGHGWAVLVGGEDALDQYFMREPERLLARTVEEAVIDLDNPHISSAHLQSAAYERPLTAADSAYFGEAALIRADGLAQSGALRRSDSGLVWSQPHSPAPETSLRSASARQFIVVESRDGSVLGTIEQERVFRFAHPGAVYLHLGKSYLVAHLDLEGFTVLVDDFDGAFYTQPKTDKNIAITGQSLWRPLGSGASLFFGTIEVTERVIAYLRRDLNDSTVVDTVQLDLPEQVFTTEALWLKLPQALLDERIVTSEIPGALHAAEHAAIAILPLYAMCDRWDIGGLSTPWHWQTDAATIFIYDGYPGGIGLAKRAYHAFEALADDARLLISECPCESGCPSCVQSPKCGNLNEPLSKAGASTLLAAIRENVAATAEE